MDVTGGQIVTALATAPAAAVVAGGLINMIRDSVGALWAPKHVRRMAEAEADAKTIAAKADSQVEMYKQAGQQLREVQEVRHLANFLDIVDEAIPLLPEGGRPDQVDRDWMNEFFDHGKNVSNEELRHLLARLLAGEVGSPGAFSRRTLATVRTLSAGEVQLFQKALACFWRSEGQGVEPMHFSPQQLDPFSIRESLVLSDAGLLQPYAGQLFSLEPDRVLIYGPQRLIVYQRERVPSFLLTSVGEELATIYPIAGDQNSVKDMGEWLNRSGTVVTREDGTRL